MNKRGTTLIESVIAIFVTSVVLLTFLQSLNVGMVGTLELSRKTSAINIAQSQIEYIKAQAFNSSNGSIADVYDLVTTANASNTSDVINYNISGTIEFVNNSTSLQKITVNVSYLQGKQVQLIGYKAALESTSPPPARGQLVTDVVKDMPFLAPGGWAVGCLFPTNGCGTWMGYYHTFQTSQSANISATWKFYWLNEVYGQWYDVFTWGAPYIGIYEGTPAWANRDYLGNVAEDGIVFRPGTPFSFIPQFPWLNFPGGCMPGCTCTRTVPGDYAPKIMHPGCSTNWSDDNWNYEIWGTQEGYFKFTVTTSSPRPAGSYTVLFFNGEDRVSCETISASVTYVY